MLQSNIGFCYLTTYSRIFFLLYIKNSKEEKMFKSIFIFFIFTVLFTAVANSQDETSMTPPPPVNNKVYESMNGDWNAESTMMGVPMMMNLKAYWDISHQFLILDLRATGKEDATQTYQGKGLFGVDGQGNAKSWWFDSWGADGVSVGSGAFSDNKLTINGGNAMYTETRSFLINENDMVMSAKGTMNTGGKETPFDETIVFKK
jgi:hypothetical protein